MIIIDYFYKLEDDWDKYTCEILTDLNFSSAKSIAVISPLFINSVISDSLDSASRFSLLPCSDNNGILINNIFILIQ